MIDATASSDDGTKSVLLFHYPRYILYRKRNVGNMEKLFGNDERFVEVEQWDCFDAYDHNLFPPEK